MTVPCLFVRRLGVDIALGDNSMRGILQRVAERHGFAVKDLQRRSATFSLNPRIIARGRARDEAMWCMWNEPDPGESHTGHRYSLHQIGKLMGLSDHTSVRTATLRHAERIGLIHRTPRRAKSPKVLNNPQSFAVVHSHASPEPCDSARMEVEKLHAA